MEIPKRKFALEEKDLSLEADENNKVAEEKENRFLKKIQEEATSNIKHLSTEKVCLNIDFDDGDSTNFNINNIKLLCPNCYLSLNGMFHNSKYFCK